MPNYNPGPIRNDKALGFIKDGRPNNKNNNKMTGDTGPAVADPEFQKLVIKSLKLPVDVSEPYVGLNA